MKTSRWSPDDPRNLVFDQCESPIEQTLCFELFERLNILADPTGGQMAPGKVFLSAQQEIGPYRADFLIVALDPKARTVLRLVVECDGAEFHADSQ